MPTQLCKSVKNAHLIDTDESSLEEWFEFLARDTNNSMPLADKPYDPPEVPENITAYFYGLDAPAKQNRETIRPVECNYVTVFLRVRRRNYENILWQLLTSGVFTKDRMYLPEYLPYWTIGIKMRLMNTYPMGRVIESMKCRLGVYNPGLRFCLDGFFGMINYTDVFGTITDACPWMEVSSFSTVKSLRMKDGDSVFISVASVGQIENVAKWRKARSLEVAIPKAAPAAAGETVENSESDDNQLVG